MLGDLNILLKIYHQLDSHWQIYWHSRHLFHLKMKTTKEVSQEHKVNLDDWDKGMPSSKEIWQSWQTSNNNHKISGLLGMWSQFIPVKRENSKKMTNLEDKLRNFRSSLLTKLDKAIIQDHTKMCNHQAEDQVNLDSRKESKQDRFKNNLWENCKRQKLNELKHNNKLNNSSNSNLLPDQPAILVILLL